MIFTILFALILCEGSNGEPIILEFSENSRADLLVQLNKLRVDAKGANMEALTEWSSDLAKIAEELGSQCSASPTHSDYGVGYVEGQSSASGIYNALDTIRKKFKLTTSACSSPVTTAECDGFKQFLWYKGGKIGCAAVYCSENSEPFATTCVFENKMRDQQLYISGDKCLFCASGKCDGDLCVPDTTTEEPPCGKKPADLVPLYRLVHKSRYDTILSTNKDIGSTVASAYENKGIFGYISTTQDSSCKHLEQLMQLSASGKVDYVYVTGTEYLSYYNQKNYNFVTTLGYVVSKPDLCGANVTAHQFIRSSTWNYYTTDEAEASEILLRTGTYSTFWLVGNAFALWSAA